MQYDRGLWRQAALFALQRQQHTQAVHRNCARSPADGVLELSVTSMIKVESQEVSEPDDPDAIKQTRSLGLVVLDSLSCSTPRPSLTADRHIGRVLVQADTTMSGSRRYREPGGRLYDEPGVGARSGMRVKESAIDLDDFLEAGRRALNRGMSSTVPSLAQSSDVEDESDDESVGTARHVTSINGRASSSMLIVQSKWHFAC